jgi:hypothetical protein
MDRQNSMTDYTGLLTMNWLHHLSFRRIHQAMLRKQGKRKLPEVIQQNILNVT